MNTLELEVYEIFKNKLGDKDAAKVIEFMDTKSNNRIETKTEMLATKDDLANTNAEIIKWMFLFWIGQVGVTIGFILLILRK